MSIGAWCAAIRQSKATGKVHIALVIDGLSLAVSPEDGKSRHFHYRWKDKQKALGRAAILKSLSKRLAADASCPRIDRMRSALASNEHRNAGKLGVWKGRLLEEASTESSECPICIDDSALGRFPRFDPFMRSMSYAQSETPYL
ncbi:TPA: hypothetical protein L5995_12315 [Pseudomonas aeruginosa]|nr:hypothetical protein [Pseudomonas aeruginosa]HBP6244145.1 hypothetical protein [Pseudomonas aeruginosa]